MMQFFKKWANPGLFLFIFSLFKQTIQLLQQFNVKNAVSILYIARGFEPMASKNKSSPITTRPLFIHQIKYCL